MLEYMQKYAYTRWLFTFVQLPYKYIGYNSTPAKTSTILNVQ